MDLQLRRSQAELLDMMERGIGVMRRRRPPRMLPRWAGRWLGRLLARLRCHLVGCLVQRLQRGQRLLVCRDCGRAWRLWRAT